MRTSTTILFLLILYASPLSAADRSTAGEFFTEPATLVSLGFEWRIDGDENRNAQVEVTYRKKGEQPWKPGPPLLRTGNERIRPDRRSRGQGSGTRAPRRPDRSPHCPQP